MSVTSWMPGLLEMLAACSYPEDVHALSHFVFHPRMNGCSNLCTLCKIAVEDYDAPDDHAVDCPYGEALRRTAPAEGELAAWIETA